MNPTTIPKQIYETPSSRASQDSPNSSPTDPPSVKTGETTGSKVLNSLHQAQQQAQIDPSKVSYEELVGDRSPNHNTFIALKKPERYKRYIHILQLVAQYFTPEVLQSNDASKLSESTGKSKIDRLVSPIDEKDHRITPLSQLIKINTKSFSNIYTKFLAESTKEYGQGNAVVIDGSLGEGALSVIHRGINTGGESSGQILNKILLQMQDSNQLTLKNYRAYIESGLNIIHEIASLSDKDEKKFMKDENFRLNFGRNHQISIPEDIKRQFKKEDGIQGCPALSVRLNVNLYGKETKLDIVQVQFLMLANRIEKGLFTP
jgi:hypothetical protein